MSSSAATLRVLVKESRPGIGVAHSRQNLESGGFSVRHFGHFTAEFTLFRLSAKDSRNPARESTPLDRMPLSGIPKITRKQGATRL